jgi:hypothetical protein
MVLVNRSIVIKGGSTSHAYDWCQLNNHHSSGGEVPRDRQGMQDDA